MYIPSSTNANSTNKEQCVVAWWFAFLNTTISTATTFGGTVGGISAQTYADNMYDFGMFAYMQRLNDINDKTAHHFIVVNYWVE